MTQPSKIPMAISRSRRQAAIREDYKNLNFNASEIAIETHPLLSIYIRTNIIRAISFSPRCLSLGIARSRVSLDRSWQQVSANIGRLTCEFRSAFT